MSHQKNQEIAKMLGEIPSICGDVSNRIAIIGASSRSSTDREHWVIDFIGIDREEEPPTNFNNFISLREFIKRHGMYSFDRIIMDYSVLKFMELTNFTFQGIFIHLYALLKPDGFLCMPLVSSQGTEMNASDYESTMPRFFY